MKEITYTAWGSGNDFCYMLCIEGINQEIVGGYKSLKETNAAALEARENIQQIPILNMGVKQEANIFNKYKR